MKKIGLIAASLLAVGPVAGLAQTAQPVADAAMPTLAEVQALRAQLEAQARDMALQRDRLVALEARLAAREKYAAAQQGRAAPDGVAVASADVKLSPSPERMPAADVPHPVGEAPAAREGMPEIAVVSDQGGIITRRGQITIEPGIEYARADRNRVIFRGIEVPQSVLVGVFDINESRQDVLTASLGARFGLSSRLEINARVPFVYRNDVSVLAATMQNSAGSTSDRSDVGAKGHDLGDLEFGARYQFTSGRNGFPFLIGGIQAVAPTGSSPFTVPRDTGTGVALKSATGAGFWGLTPTITALLPTDPAVLFATLGYTHNFARNFDGVQLNTDVLIDRINPGDALSGSGGIGISLNPRVALSLGYAQTWSFGTRTAGRQIVRNPVTGTSTIPFDSASRDLQTGRFLFGISYRTSPSTTINWNVEVGATQDAPDVRTTIRIPFSFGGG